ncbi:glycosyltransferase family 2 protein [Ferrovum myxofaciens]|uniref:glycosyltransferase family 2 protein n=1 Tax=Ferrovum myxofaciens TaxID=416213 RepID=UPI0004E0C464|nr:glycosyltransferase family 2 protein [Ferrovum myxofaciens]
MVEIMNLYKLEKKRVLVSILNWNGGDESVACLYSLFESNYKSFSVVVIDNASTDNSPENIKCLFPQVTLIRNSENRGFASAQNQGIRYAIEKHFEYIWILNNDTIIDANALGLLVYSLDSDASIGAVSPILLDNDNSNSNRIQFCGCSINRKLRYFEQHKFLDEGLKAQSENPKDFCLWGTALLTRTTILKKIGGFDDKLFAYFEDMDLSIRIIKLGFYNRIVEQSIVFHAGVNDPNSRPPHYVYLNTRNRYLFWINYLPWHQQVNYTRQYLAGSLLLAASWHDVGDSQRETATLLGIWDALRRRGGGWVKERSLPKWVPSILLTHPYIFVNILRGDILGVTKKVFKRQSAPSRKD